MLEFWLVKALRAFTLDVSLEVADDGLVLAGPSGAGKTTVLKAVAGLLRPDAGWIRCDKDLWFDHRQDVWRNPECRGVGYMFQDFALFPHLSVSSNVGFGLSRLDRPSRQRRALQLLERFGIAQLANARPSELSGGERQRVALARALAPRPSCLLLDEPLSALDATTRPQAARELRGLLAEAQVPTIVVSHDFIEAAMLTRRIAVVDRGRVAQSGSFEQLAAMPQTAFVADFCGANLLRGQARAVGSGLTQVALDGGRQVLSTDSCHGAVGVAVFPWDVTVDAGSAADDGASSRLNQLSGTVSSLTVVSNRARVVVHTPQPLVAEITAQSAARLDLREGTAVTAAWKATATRLVSLE